MIMAWTVSVAMVLAKAWFGKSTCERQIWQVNGDNSGVASIESDVGYWV